MKKAPGLLPNTGWLQTNGYAALDTIIRKHPEAFSHIQQESKAGRRPQEWVPIAEQLAKEHGVLPNTGWLTKNGYRSLLSAMWANPQLFAHIQREIKKRKQHEWVSIAEQLAKENNGTLPYPEWLVTHGYGGIMYAKHGKPELFSHIQQRSKAGRAPQEWVPIAEQLAEEHGVLPFNRWLAENGYGGLSRAKRKHPELFSHIRQEVKRRDDPHEWIPVAEQLAKENGGILRSPNWLVKNRYSGLNWAIKKHPQLFAHIPQTRYGRPIAA